VRFFRCQFLEEALESYTLALFTRNGWSKSEVQVLLAKVRNEIKSNRMHIYTYWYVFSTQLLYRLHYLKCIAKHH